MHGDMIYLDRKYLPLISEALALCKALTWLKEHGIHHIIVEYDALQLFQCLFNQDNGFLL